MIPIKLELLLWCLFETMWEVEGGACLTIEAQSLLQAAYMVLQLLLTIRQSAWLRRAWGFNKQCSGMAVELTQTEQSGLRHRTLQVLAMPCLHMVLAPANCRLAPTKWIYL